MDTITDACKAGVEKVKEAFSGASKESNIDTAKDSSQSAGTRVGAAINAAGDKVDETTHAAKKEVHKQEATH